MNSYKDLEVWKKSIQLCVDIYKITDNFPKNEIYGLTSQIRRCCVSIPSNIAEGQHRGHRGEFVQFLRIAYGSAAELETQLLIASKVSYIDNFSFDKINTDLNIIIRMLNKLMNSF
jgi:four helix bundle protein